MPVALFASQLGRSHVRCAPAVATLAWGSTSLNKVPNSFDDPASVTAHPFTAWRRP